MAEPSTSVREPGQPPLPDRVTMPLLALVTREAVDEDYVHAARRRAAAGVEGPRRPLWVGAGVATALFGLLVALAAIQTARNADVQQASRDALIERIDQRRAEVASLRDRVDALRTQDDQLATSNARVRGQQASATVDLRALEISTGFVAVSGPGLRFTIADSPDGSADGRVRATDLRLLVNGLWQAGADAIAINGRRLTTTSAIAQSNIAIGVNRQPLTPPYVVSAIGAASLGAKLQATTSGAEFQALADQFGFKVDRQNESELLLPSAPDFLRRLRYAQQGNPRDTQEDLP